MKMFAVMFLVLGLIGCATTKVMQWQATGGSRADGVVELSYQYGWLDVPQVDDYAGELLAQQRCESWGYEGAEAFGGQVSTCVQPGGSVCHSMLVTKQFQCLGDLED